VGGGGGGCMGVQHVAHGAGASSAVHQSACMWGGGCPASSGLRQRQPAPTHRPAKRISGLPPSSGGRGRPLPGARRCAPRRCCGGSMRWRARAPPRTQPGTAHAADGCRDPAHNTLVLHAGSGLAARPASCRLPLFDPVSDAGGRSASNTATFATHYCTADAGCCIAARRPGASVRFRQGACARHAWSPDAATSVTSARPHWLSACHCNHSISGGAAIMQARCPVRAGGASRPGNEPHAGGSSGGGALQPHTNVCPPQASQGAQRARAGPSLWQQMAAKVIRGAAPAGGGACPAVHRMASRPPDASTPPSLLPCMHRWPPRALGRGPLRQDPAVLQRAAQPAERVQVHRQPAAGGRLARAGRALGGPATHSPGLHATTRAYLHPPARHEDTATCTHRHGVECLRPARPQAPAAGDVVSVLAAGPTTAASSAGVVLVTGATGGVGKRVVQRLLQRGRVVRALVRDVAKAKELLVSCLPGDGVRRGAAAGVGWGGGGGDQHLTPEHLGSRARLCLVPTSPAVCSGRWAGQGDDNGWRPPATSGGSTPTRRSTGARHPHPPAVKPGSSARRPPGAGGGRHCAARHAAARHV